MQCHKLDLLYIYSTSALHLLYIYSSSTLHQAKYPIVQELAANFVKVAPRINVSKRPNFS